MKTIVKTWDLGIETVGEDGMIALVGIVVAVVLFGVSLL